MTTTYHNDDPMINGLVTMRTRAAEEAEGHPTRIGFRPARLASRFELSGGILSHDVSQDEEVRVWLTSSDAPTSRLPQPEIELRRPGIVGVRCDGRADHGTPFVHFLSASGPLTSRPLTFGDYKWFEPPEGATALAVSVVVTGVGSVEIDQIDVVVPPHGGTLPGPGQLLDDLAVSRFPVGPTAWPLRHSVETSPESGLRVNGQSIDLKSIDWEALSTQSRSWQLLIHGFGFAEAAIAAGRTEELGRLFVDWSERHPERPHSTTVMAWNDMAVAKRTMAMLAALDVLRFSAPVLAGTLADLIARHAAWLAHPRNYLSGHDHGLYSDTALEFASRVLWMHPLARRWSELACRRFASTAETVIDTNEGTVLEHSPAYVSAVADLVAERRRSGLRDQLPSDLGARFTETLSKLSTPTGTLVPWGDTALDAPGVDTPSTGAWSLLNSGWAVSHHEDSMTGLTSSYHSASHKHGDELSVVYYDENGPVLFEAGLPGYEYKSADRDYAESPRAHNTTSVEGASIPWREATPFGSGIWPVATAGPWQLIAGSNPLLTGARHDRLVFHHPEILLIVDVLVGPMISESSRFFHIAPSHEVSVTDASLIQVGHRTMTVFSTGSPTRPEVGVGDEWVHFPSSSSSDRHPTVILRDSGPGVRTLLLSGQDKPPKVQAIDTAADRHQLVLAIRLTDGTVLTTKARPAVSPGTVSLDVE